MKWKKIEEELPTRRDCDKNDIIGFSVDLIVSDGTNVWDDVICEFTRKFAFEDEVELNFWVHRFGYDNDSFKLDNITHWMPLPEPPKQKNPRK